MPVGFVAVPAWFPLKCNHWKSKPLTYPIIELLVTTSTVPGTQQVLNICSMNEQYTHFSTFQDRVLVPVRPREGDKKLRGPRGWM